MSSLVLHAAMAAQLDRLTADPPHAVLLVAPEGSGKRAVADRLAAALLDRPVTALRPDAGYHVVEPERTGVTIEAVRRLQHFAKLRTAGAGRRVAIIEQAHTMSVEAQNAALKLIEEPPAGMTLLLTAAHEQALLPTVRSRTQTLRLRQPPRQAVTDHFTGQGYPAASVERAALLSGGLPGLMTALLSETAHPLSTTVEQARAVLGATPLERLGLVDAAAKDRTAALRLCAMLQRMAGAALGTAAAKGARPAIQRWYEVLRAGADAEAALRGNAQPKLVLTDLMLNL